MKTTILCFKRGGRNLILILLLVFYYLYSYSQEICEGGTFEPIALQNFSIIQELALQTPTEIKVYFVVYRDNDGSNGVGINRLYEIMNRLNKAFEPARFSFIWRECETIFIDDSFLNNNTNRCLFNALHNDGLNLHIRGDNKAWGVYALTIPGNVAILGGTFLASNHPLNGTVGSSSAMVVHEVGHCLGLFHTQFGTCTTLEKISKCNANNEVFLEDFFANDGDFVEDTHLDPDLTRKVDQDCKWNGEKCSNPNIPVVNPLTNN